MPKQKTTINKKLEIESRPIIDKLTTTSEYNKLKGFGRKLFESRDEFDIVTLFENIIDENAWSSIFSYLLDSSKNHGLKTSPIECWLKNINSSYVNPILRIINGECSVESKTEWGTDEGRRIDILLKIRNNKSDIIAVLGIENKVDSGEQTEQLSDYQKAIVRNYPKVPKLLIFLTPDGRKSQTSMLNKECPCIAVSYISIINTCEELSKPLNKEKTALKQFLSSLQKSLTKMTKENKYESDIKLTLKKLYADPDHRRAIKLIQEYSPNIQTVLEGLRDRLENSTLKKPFDFSEATNQTSSNNIFMLYFPKSYEIAAIKKLGVCYMLHFHKDGNPPDIDDEVTLRVMIHVKDNNGGKERKNKIFTIAQMENSFETQHWWQWVNIWADKKYKLVDLGEKDISNLEKLMVNGINKTYSEVISVMNKLKRSKLI